MYWGARTNIMPAVEALHTAAANLAVTAGYYPAATYQITVAPPAMP